MLHAITSDFAAILQEGQTHRVTDVEVNEALYSGLTRLIDIQLAHSRTVRDFQDFYGPRAKMGYVNFDELGMKPIGLAETLLAVQFGPEGSRYKLRSFTIPNR